MLVADPYWLEMYLEMMVALYWSTPPTRRRGYQGVNRTAVHSIAPLA